MITDKLFYVFNRWQQKDDIDYWQGPEETMTLHYFTLQQKSSEGDMSAFHFISHKISVNIRWPL